MNREKRSYGIACCRFNMHRQKMEILLVQKRCTYYFVEFVLGHYKKQDDKRLVYLFNNMMISEKLDILSLSFGQMWYRFCLINPETQVGALKSDEYERYFRCKKHFEAAFMPDKGRRIRSLIDRSKCRGTVWDIPKGRANPQEKSLNAAVREFYEETSIDESLYDILMDIRPRRMTFVSSNVKYVYTYYTAVINGKPSTNKSGLSRKVSRSLQNQSEYVKLNFRINQQVSEIVSVKWVSLGDIKIIGDNRIYNFVKPLFQVLRKKYKLRRLTNLSLL